MAAGALAITMALQPERERLPIDDGRTGHDEAPGPAGGFGSESGARPALDYDDDGAADDSVLGELSVPVEGAVPVDASVLGSGARLGLEVVELLLHAASAPASDIVRTSESRIRLIMSLWVPP
jgi:hypothetical protein